jgi:hypothetical protein
MVVDDSHVAALKVAVDTVVGEFEFGDEQVKSAVNEFLLEMSMTFDRLSKTIVS